MVVNSRFQIFLVSNYYMFQITVIYITKRKHTRREGRWGKNTWSGDIYEEKTLTERKYMRNRYIQRENI